MIGFHHLEVADFRGIRQAAIPFSAGLNVLYGNNELGKSSLVAALRAALFMPAGAAEAIRDYQSWGTENVPSVTLTFEVENSTYRIHKQFATGSRATAALYQLTGSELTGIANGRQVDSKLRELIAWGLPEAGRAHGLAESYLSRALLGFQDEVESVLRASIEADKTDTGKQALTRALGALGQDPLVVSIVDQLKARTSQVYTTSGQLKKAQGSPLVHKAYDREWQEKELYRLQQGLREGEAVEGGLGELKQQLDAALENKDELKRLIQLAVGADNAQRQLGASGSWRANLNIARDTYTQACQAAEEVQHKLKRASQTAEQAEKSVQIIKAQLASLDQQRLSLQNSDEKTSQVQCAALDAEIKSVAVEIARVQSCIRLAADTNNIAQQLKQAEAETLACDQRLQLAKHQRRYSECLQERDHCLKDLNAIYVAKKEAKDAEEVCTQAEGEHRELLMLVDHAQRACEIRSQLTQEAERRSGLDQAIAGELEAATQLQDIRQQWQSADQQLQQHRQQLAECQQQLATLKGRRQSLLDASLSLQQSNKQALQSNIVATRQRISLAESVCVAQQERSRLTITRDGLRDQLEQHVAALDTADNNLKCAQAAEVLVRAGQINTTKARLTTEIQAIQATVDSINAGLTAMADGNPVAVTQAHGRQGVSASPGMFLTNKRKSSIITIAVSILAIALCVAAWLLDYFSAVVFAAPIVLLGGIAASLLQRTELPEASADDQTDNYPSIRADDKRLNTVVTAQTEQLQHSSRPEAGNTTQADSTAAPRNSAEKLQAAIAARQIELYRQLSHTQLQLGQKQGELQSITPVAAELVSSSRDLLNAHKPGSNLQALASSIDDLTQQRELAVVAVNQCQQQLAIADSELSSAGRRHQDLAAQLGGDADTLLVELQHNLQLLSTQLDQADVADGVEISRLDTRIEPLQRSIDGNRQKVQQLQLELNGFEKKITDAQNRLGSCKARVQQLKVALVNKVDLQNEFNQLAPLLSGASERSPDLFSVDSIKSLQTELAKRAARLEPTVKKCRDRLAVAKAQLDTLQQARPDVRLAKIDAEIKALKRSSTAKPVSMSVKDAELAVATAARQHSESRARLENYRGQAQAATSELQNQHSESPASYESQLAGLQQTLSEKQQQHRDLQLDHTQEIDALQIQINGLQQQLPLQSDLAVRKIAEKSAMASRYDDLQQKATEARVALDQLEKQNDGTQVQQANAAIQRAINESDGVLNDRTPFSQQLEALQAKLDTESARTKELETQWQMSRGKLELIGGAVLREKIQRQAESVARVQQEARELEAHCDAEKYLLEVISETGRQYTTHLGRMLSEPVSRTFSELTGNRYAGFTLDPELTAAAVVADGDDRDYRKLSVGARHQLAVLIRLSLAAYLKASLVLDDQLVQSDTKRLTWFRNTLLNSVRNNGHQIIVITCRPEDYGVPFEEKGTDDSAVELEAVVQR